MKSESTQLLFDSLSLSLRLSPPKPRTTKNLSHPLALQKGLELLALLQHRPPRRAALGVPPLGRGGKVPHLGDVVGKERVDRAEVGRREVRQGAAPVLRHLDGGAAQVVGLAEGDPCCFRFCLEEGEEGGKKERELWGGKKG